MISAIKLELKFRVHRYDAGGERKLVKTLSRTAFPDFFRRAPRGHSPLRPCNSPRRVPPPGRPN